MNELVVIGLSTILLGTIREADGVQQHAFWLRNDGTHAVTLMQGYTSCGCTTIDFERGLCVAPGDSTCVTLSFDPRGKSDEFLEVGTIAYLPTDSVEIAPATQRHRVQMALEGECIASDESLLRQHPIPITDYLRLSKARFDIGVMRQGAKRTVNVSVLHRDEGDRREPFSITFEVTADMPKGLQHVERMLTTHDATGAEVTFAVILDVLVK